MTTVAIAVVDLSGIFWANFMATKEGDPVSSAHDWTVHKVRRIAQDFEHVGVACDAKTNWRKERSPSYKAQRLERPEAAWAQLAHTIETLRAEGFPIWHVEGYEADDIMATVAHEAASRGNDVVLVTNDKDLRQCIRDATTDSAGVSVLTPGDSRAQPQRITEANCGMEKTLIPPRMVRDFLALRGDGSDNVPGVRGIGPVKAMALLSKFKTFMGVVAAFEGNDPTLLASPEGRALAAVVNPDAPPMEQRRGIDDAKLSWELVGLRDNAPIDWSEALRERVPTAVDSAPSEPVPDDEPEDEDEDEPAASSGPTVREHVAAKVERGEPIPDVGTAIQQTTTAIVQAVTHQPWNTQLEPHSMRGADWLANEIANSRLYPNLVTKQQVLVAMMLGRIYGLPAPIACMNCVPIMGKMAMTSQMKLAIVLAHPLCEYLESVEDGPSKSIWVAKRRGRPERRLEFTIEQARKAGYTYTKPGKGPSKWETDPQTMLHWRCGTRIAAWTFPDVLTGVYSVEEMEDAGTAAVAA